MWNNQAMNLEHPVYALIESRGALLFDVMMYVYVLYMYYIQTVPYYLPGRFIQLIGPCMSIFVCPIDKKICQSTIFRKYSGNAIFTFYLSSKGLIQTEYGATKAEFSIKFTYFPAILFSQLEATYVKLAK